MLVVQRDLGAARGRPTAVPPVRGEVEMITFVDRPSDPPSYHSKNKEFYGRLMETLENGKAILCTIQQYRCAQSRYRTSSDVIFRSVSIDGGQGGYTVWLERRQKVL